MRLLEVIIKNLEKGVPAQPEELQVQDPSSRTAFLGPYSFVTAPPTKLDEIAKAQVQDRIFRTLVV